MNQYQRKFNGEIDNSEDDDNPEWTFLGMSTSEAAHAIEQRQLHKYRCKGGHGFAFEDANALRDMFMGNDVELAGWSNEENGPDRIVNGVAIQSKCYASTEKTIESLFDSMTGLFKYKGQISEIPADQYEEGIVLLREKISAGKVPDVTDPGEAENMLRKSSYTYKQARNIARPGNFDSLLFDAQCNAVSGSFVFGISFVISYARAAWDGKPHGECIKSALADGLEAGAVSVVSGITAAQILRSGFATQSTVVVRKGVRVIYNTSGGKKAIEAIAKASLGRPVYGQAAMNHVSRLLRSNAITGTIVFSASAGPDFYRTLIAGSQSWAQLSKNLMQLAASMLAGAAGWVGGSTVGTALGAWFGGAGAAPGYWIGGTAGSTVMGVLGGKLSAKLLGKLIKDDAEKLIALINDAATQVSFDFLLGASELEELIAELQRIISVKWLRNMYKAGKADDERKAFAYVEMERICEQIAARRLPITMPTEEEVLTVLNKAIITPPE